MGGFTVAYSLFPLLLGRAVSALDTLSIFWIAVFLSAAAIAPYVLLRRTAQSESWRTAIMHSYLPWLATILVILGIFGVG